MTPATPTTKSDQDVRIRQAFEQLKVRAILGTSSWASMSLKEAKQLQGDLPPHARPVFVLDRSSINESVLDVDIIDIRIHLFLAAAAGNRGAQEFGLYSENMYLGLEDLMPAFVEDFALAEDQFEPDGSGELGDPIQDIAAAMVASVSH